MVPGNFTLGQLHRVIQIVMGWEDDHLHIFRVGDKDYENEYMTLMRLAPAEKFKFRYLYDFGDNWLHDILVEKILPPAPTQELPLCIKGARACPPEDVGGIWGYYDFLEARRNPDHPAHDHYMEWFEEEWDEEAFDLNKANERLRACWQRTKRG